MTLPLFPTWQMPATVQQTAQSRPPPSYPPSVAFDFNLGDFVLDGTGTPLVTLGDEAWGVWCAKAILTEWNTYPVYTAAYGLDYAPFRGSDHALVEAQLTRGITAALLADPRTASVQNVTFAWFADELGITLTATPTIGSTRTFTVRLTF